MMCPRAKVYTRHRNKLEKHKSAAAGEIKGGEWSFRSRLLSSHLDIEAEASVFIRSHLDQDQVIVRDYSVQLKEHKSSLQHHGSARCQTTAQSAQTLTAADPVSLTDSFSFLLHELMIQMQIQHNTDGFKCTTVHQNKVVHFRTKSPTFLAFLAQISLFKKCNQ